MSRVRHTGNRLTFLGGGAVAAILLGLGVSACRSDGTTLRPPRADQNSTISTTSGPPVDEPSFELPATLPSEPTQQTLVDLNVGGFGKVFAPWADGALIDSRYTCDGENVSPSLSWPVAPEGTDEIGVAMVDLDAPDFAHWTIVGLDPGVTELAENELPLNAVEAINGAGTAGYYGPCPPEGGEAHQYQIIVFYLGETLEADPSSIASELLGELTAAAIETADVTGFYSRTTS